VLVVGGRSDDIGSITRQLERVGVTADATGVADVGSLDRALADAPWDVLLSDDAPASTDALQVLDMVRNADRHLSVVLVAAALDVDRALLLVRAGAADVVRGGDPVRLAPVLLREARAARDRRELTQLRRDAARSRRLERVAELTSHVAHDINNVLQVVLSTSQLALRDEPPPALAADLRGIASAARCGAEVLQGLLDLCSDAPVARQRPDIGAAVHALEGPLRCAAGARRTLALEVEDDLPVVVLGAGQIERILLNLVLNARDATDRGGTIRVRVRRGGSPTAPVLRIDVEDDGVGMSDEIAARVFRPGFTTRGPKGTGLGLASVYGIVKGAGGDIWLRTAPGRGAVFSITLPPAGPAGALAEAS
jgi:two-component system cell cycle sensor histidine kinase/response regulator CckA